MPKIPAYAVRHAGAPFTPVTIERRRPRAEDVVIDILYCGVCHSDVHQVRDDWGRSTYPMVPGHEIVGRVAAVGRGVRRFAVGDAVGVGCFVDSCRRCARCRAGGEQFCDAGVALTYNGTLMDRRTRTQGGYSTQIVVAEPYVIRIPPRLDLAAAAPLLCAGITTWSPLKQWGTKQGDRVAVVGLGGLGHMAVKLASSMGAEVTLFSHSRGKRADALRLGAGEFVLSSRERAFTDRAGRFDLVIDTVSASHDYNRLLRLLRPYGTLVVLGVPPDPATVDPGLLVGKSRRLAGSLIGGIAETQALVDYCARKKIGADVELIRMDEIDEAYARLLRADVRYRFVIDLDSLRARPPQAQGSSTTLMQRSSFRLKSS